MGIIKWMMASNSELYIETLAFGNSLNYSEENASFGYFSNFFKTSPSCLSKVTATGL